ncbi:MAG: class I SAM-dependent methyltransferase [Thermosulfidibacteraceae bacterium]
MVAEKILKRVETLLGKINRLSDKKIGVILPNGKRLMEDAEVFVEVREWDVLCDILKDPELGFARAYMDEKIEVLGDLEDVLVAGNRFVRKLEDQNRSWYRKLWDCLFYFFSSLFVKNRLDKEKRDVEYHYNLGNDFYSLWLDESLTYSCAFFEDPSWSIEKAQREKRKIIYEKLQLKAGETLLDIGCGWGSIIIESAKELGVYSTGITLSGEQYKYVLEKIKEKNLEGRVEVYLLHYMELPKLKKEFDKVVSVGMFEHVGKRNIRKFFEVVSSVMKNNALFLLHTIGKEHEGNTSKFMTTYIFPGGYLPSISEIIENTRGLNLSLLDVDDWRMHYYYTLKKWRERFSKYVDRIRDKYGNRFVRMWDFYLTTSMSAFKVGNTHLFQVLFSKGVKNDYPIIRRRLIPLVQSVH